MEHIRRLTIYFFILLPTIIFPKNLIEALQSEKETGTLSTGAYLTHLVYALYEPARLPESYRHFEQKPIKSGTFLHHYLQQHRELLDEPARVIFEAQDVRPDLPYSIISPSGYFKVHYTDSGSDAISPVDDDNTGLPDYAEEAARALDYAFKLIVDSLGYREPLNDEGQDGNEYDVYLVNLGSRMYGETVFELQKTAKPETWTTYTRINAYFDQSFPTRGVAAVCVTCAHEFFHAVQLAYSYRADDEFFFEASSTWIEDYAHDGVNDYVHYLNAFFSKPNTSFDKKDGSHEYGLSIWNHMLCKKFGPDVIRWTWERMAEKPEQGALGALDDALIKAGTSFNLELISFSLWNFFTGSRADTINYYPEGNLYPEIAFKEEYSFQTDISIADSSKKFAPLYYFFNDSENDRTFSVILINLEYHNKDWNAHSQYQLEIVTVPVNQLYEEMDTRLYIQLNAPEIDYWRGRVAILYSDKSAKIIEFGPKTTSPAEKEGTILYLFPNPFVIGQDHEFKVYIRLEQRNWVEAMILSSQGRLVKNINIPGFIPGYLEKNIYPQLEWDGTNDRGEEVAGGIYIFCLKIDDSVVLKKFGVIRK